MANQEKSDRPLPRPLYKSSGGAKFSTEANAGLWYDKFVDRWEGNSWDQAKANKLAWIKTVTDPDTGPVGCPKLINEFASRVKRLAEQSGGRTFALITESRFVTGLGREHPIENGFAWHHTLGTPYLPGSSIKGLIRNWAEQWDHKKSDAKTILGGPGSVGRILLLDALPTSQPLLEADVMTPHYSAYYQKGEAPGDWLSPTPIPFLTVAAGTPFQLAIIPNTAADAQYLDIVTDWLFQALEWLGAGAKTAVGYGRFQRDKETEMRLAQEAAKLAKELQERQAREARLAGLTHALRQLVEQAEAEHWSDGQSQFLDGVDRYLAQTPTPTADAIAWIRNNCLEKFWKGIWADPEAKRGKKGDKYKFESKRARELVQRLQHLETK